MSGLAVVKSPVSCNNLLYAFQFLAAACEFCGIGFIALYTHKASWPTWLSVRGTARKIKGEGICCAVGGAIILPGTMQPRQTDVLNPKWRSRPAA